MLTIQKYLRSLDPRTALKQAEEKWGIESYQDGKLIALNYSMFKSPRGVPEVEECRGLILEDLTWNLVAQPFYRFYNYGEDPYAAKYNLNTSTLWEKLDGTLCTVYFYNNWKEGGWCVATRGRPNADGSVNNNSAKSFNQLFRETWKTQGMQEPVIGYTYMFELVGPENRVVTPYTSNKIYLLGIRCVKSIKEGITEELSLQDLKDIAELKGWTLPKIYEFSNADHIDNILKTLPGLAEGFVLCDYGNTVGNGWARVKIKNPGYLAAAAMLGHGMSDKRIMESILRGNDKEFLSYFPEYAKEFQAVENKIVRFCYEATDMFRSIKDMPTRKDFADRAKEFSAPWVLFTMLDGKVADSWNALELATVDKAYNAIFGTAVIVVVTSKQDKEK